MGGGLPSELATFVASAAAAIDVQIVCNREPIRPSKLFKLILPLNTKNIENKTPI